MLSVGREINIGRDGVVCRECAWEGVGSSLSTALARIAAAIYLYAYRCPDCGSFDLTRKGRVLEFRLQSAADRESDPATSSATQNASQPRHERGGLR